VGVNGLKKNNFFWFFADTKPIFVLW